MAHERILIVDDERDVAESLGNLLSLEEYAVDVAATLPEAESLLHKNL